MIWLTHRIPPKLPGKILVIGTILAAFVMFAPVARADSPAIGILATAKIQSEVSRPIPANNLAIGRLITTGPSEQSQLLFVDGSAIFVGPNSSLRIERFSYDAAGKTGEIIIQVAKGQFRFVGGQISKQRPVLFKSGGAVVGIRGGVADITVIPAPHAPGESNQGQPMVSATMLFGQRLFLQAGTAQQVVTRPGFKVSLAANGRIAPPYRAAISDLTMPAMARGKSHDHSGASWADTDLTPRQLSQIAPSGGGINVARIQLAPLRAINTARINTPGQLQVHAIHRTVRRLTSSTTQITRTSAQPNLSGGQPAREELKPEMDEVEDSSDDDAGLSSTFIDDDGSSRGSVQYALIDSSDLNGGISGSFSGSGTVSIVGTYTYASVFTYYTSRYFYIDSFGSSRTSYVLPLITLPEDNTSITTRTLWGYSAGVLSSRLGGSDPTEIGFFSPVEPMVKTLFSTADGSPSNIRISTNAETNKVQAEFTIDHALAGIPTQLTLRFGDVDLPIWGRGVFADDKRFYAIQNASNPSTASDPITTTELALWTNGTARSSAPRLSDADLCGCEYLTWGFWAANLEYADGRVDQISLAPWVAGEIAGLANIQGMTGSATYTGHVIGTVVANGIQHTALGNLSYSMNFDNPAASSGAIGNYDGGNYALSGMALSAAGAGHKFSGTLNGTDVTAAGRTGTFTGSFMSGGGDNAAEMGGQMLITGTNYQSAGIFAARKTSAP